MVEEKRYTTKEAAEQLGITAARVRQMVIAGRLKADKFGRDVMIKQSDLDAVKDRQPGRPPKAKESAK